MELVSESHLSASSTDHVQLQLFQLRFFLPEQMIIRTGLPCIMYKATLKSWRPQNKDADLNGVWRRLGRIYISLLIITITLSPRLRPILLSTTTDRQQYLTNPIAHHEAGHLTPSSKALQIHWKQETPGRRRPSCPRESQSITIAFTTSASGNTRPDIRSHTAHESGSQTFSPQTQTSTPFATHPRLPANQT